MSIDSDLAASYPVIWDTQNDLLKSIDKKLDQYLQLASDIPRDIKVVVSGVCPTPTVAFSLKSAVGGIGPEAGEVWVLRRIAVGGITPTTTATGRADIYMSGQDPTAGGSLPFTGDWIDQATTLPLTAGYSNRQCVLRSNDNLFVVITNGLQAQQYVANLQFSVYREGTIQPELDI